MEPDELFEKDTVEFPCLGINEMFGENYGEAVRIFAVRLWKFFEKNNIDTSRYSTSSELDDDYHSEISELAEGLGISVTQFDGAATLAMRFNEEGFDEVVENMNQTVTWEPKNELTKDTKQRHYEDLLSTGALEDLLNRIDDSYHLKEIRDEMPESVFEGLPEDIQRKLEESN